MCELSNDSVEPAQQVGRLISHSREDHMKPEELEALEKDFEAELDRLEWDSDNGGYDETRKVFEAFRRVIGRLPSQAGPL